MVGVIVSVAIELVRLKIKETARVLGVGTLYGAIFAALFVAPLPQINSQSDDIDIPGDFAFTDIQYDVFPSANPQWMHSMLTPSLSAVDCSRIVWLSWPTYSQSYEGAAHWDYFCVGNYRKLMDCVTDAEKNRNTAIVNALIDNAKCLEKARNVAAGCLLACPLTGKYAPACVAVCGLNLAAQLANCKSDKDAAIAKINNNADAAIEKCIDKYKTHLL